MQDIARGEARRRKAKGEEKAKEEVGDDGTTGLRAAVLDAAINLQTVISEIVKSKARQLKKDNGVEDGRRQRQPTRNEGCSCGGKRCAYLERTAHTVPNRLKESEKQCGACGKKETAVKRANEFEAAIMGKNGTAWRWQLARLLDEEKPVKPGRLTAALMRDGSAVEKLEDIFSRSIPHQHSLPAQPVRPLRR